MSFDKKHALVEFNSLVFARVSRVVQKEPDETTKGTKKDDDKFYYGFAVRVKQIEGTRKENTIWFKSTQHCSNKHGFFAMGISHVPKNTPPARGDILVGKVIKMTKGYSYVWWTHHARPWLEFSRMLSKGKRSMRIAAKVYELLKLEHTRSGTTDDLYLVARLLILNDVGSLMAQLFAEENRPKHPRKKDKEGYQRQKGFHTEFPPIELAYYVAEFARDDRILQECVNYINTYAQKVVEWPTVDMSNYSMDRLRDCLK